MHIEKRNLIKCNCYVTLTSCIGEVDDLNVAFSCIITSGIIVQKDGVPIFHVLFCHGWKYMVSRVSSSSSVTSGEVTSGTRAFPILFLSSLAKWWFPLNLIFQAPKFLKQSIIIHLHQQRTSLMFKSDTMCYTKAISLYFNIVIWK